MSFELPKRNQTGPNEWKDVEDNDQKLKEEIEATQAETEAIPTLGKWYPPKIIAGEESRESTSFGKLSTPDEIAGVVVPENGLLVIGYQALVKQSVGSAARAAVFIGTNQLKKTGSTSDETGAFATTSEFVTVASSSIGLWQGSSGSQASTGQVLGADPVGNIAGLISAFVAAGTYSISVQFKASSGNVKAKERKLWAYVLGA